MRHFILVAITLALLGCSKSDDLDIRLIFISVDKEVALENGDTVRIFAEVKDQELDLINGLELEFFANDVPLGDSIFITGKRGEVVLQARYRGVESNRVTVRVVDLTQDLEGLNLLYQGYRKLTTNEWSISGDFSYEARIGGRTFPIDGTGIDLLLNGSPVNQTGQFHFPEEGIKDFQARSGSVLSNTVSIDVRPEKVFTEVVIPVIFHAYGVSVLSTDVRNFIDTLNSSFFSTSFPREAVLSGDVNPNAVNCYIRFELARTPPPGFTLTEPGLNVISNEDGQFPPLTEATFVELERRHNWAPETFVNVWLAEGYEFQYEPLNKNESGGSGGARGLAYSPYLLDAELKGLPTFGSDPRIPDPNTLSHSILLRTGSVLGEHRDYLVNRMGYFLGLFDTMSFGCLFEGDYCSDTFPPDLENGDRLGNAWTSCEDGNFYQFNNHMSLGRNYTNFTYDQRERMRFVLEHGMFRPSGQ